MATVPNIPTWDAFRHLSKLNNHRSRMRKYRSNFLILDKEQLLDGLPQGFLTAQAVPSLRARLAVELLAVIGSTLPLPQPVETRFYKQSIAATSFHLLVIKSLQ